VASRPPIDPATAERLEAAAVAQVQRMREQLTTGEAREVERRPFSGRFTV
jgi:hypothetical protein